ncbi:PAS domain S-box protein [Sideroxydans lithotrophicus]|uniref:Diguanylate cyclase with PAS/PAC sensor n=1 Tax=Sideroxydans lithotrophicus (strain ES-1) TaxID=580332 RepID=D5CUR7_SIDLE|nr:PAS domain S-box protein [Sideroxydans lithotrophicus]ADE12454.1 diguanylate cyclase with PAS/PAC sensor [Sideroxydans lithotrophicus ES-1]
MRFGDIGLSTRITLWALLFVVAGGLLWINQDMKRDQESYLSERSADLKTDIHLEQARLAQSISALRKDLLFLASVPPISGIVRASANGGIDLRDKTSMAVWQERLQEIFAAFLQAHPEYHQLSYIAAAGEGRELVRVDNSGGRIEVIPREALQAKGDQAFFKAGLVLTAGRVHLSEFTLNQEHGKVEEPHRPTLYAVTTVFDANGNVFGMVVINKDVRSLFDLVSNGLQADVRSYVSDQYGHYLLRPEAGPASVPAEGNRGNIADDFPVLKPAFAVQSMQDESVQTMNDGKGGYLAFERMFFDPSDPSRFLLLANDLPASSKAHRFDAISPPNLAYTLLGMLLVSSLFMLILRHTFSPLKRITAAAKEIAAGNRDIRLTETGKGEIGKLADALNMMLDRLSGSDLIERENTFRKALIEALPGVFYMIDAQGRFMMWNHNLEQVVQRSPEEMASSHPLDFFEGEDKVNIEKAIRQVFEAGDASVEAELVAKDGSKTPFHFTGKRVMHEGMPILVGLGLDISKQREDSRLSEAMLRRNEALMRNSMEGIHVMDVDGNLLEANEAFCNMLGYAREEMMHLHVTDWNKQFSAGELRSRMQSRIGKSETFETVHQRKDGTLLDVEICATGVEIDGKGYMFASSRDITERKKLLSVYRRYMLVLETAMDGFWMADANGFLEDANEAYVKMSGYTMKELVGMHISELEANESEEAVKAHMEKLMAQGYGRFETRHRRKDGRVIDVEVAVTFLVETGKFFVFSHNITQRKQAEQALRIAAAAFETHEAILITDAQVNIIRVNKAFTDITGYTPEEAMGKNPRFMSSGRHDREYYAAMWQQILETGTWAGEIWDRRKSGEIYPKWMNITVVKNDRGETTQYVSIFSDITERKKAEDEIRNLAFYDPLTLLPNRRLFLERFHTALAASARYGDFGSILFLDLDRFKLLNDKFGHDYGDLLLVEVASRIKACVREIDTVARFGGDEFVVLLESISSDREEAAHKSGVVAEKIRDALSRPYRLKELEYRCSPSIGISLYHGNDDSMDVLLKYADAAMYQAKDAGRNNVRFYDPEMQSHWESELMEQSHEGNE